MKYLMLIYGDETKWDYSPESLVPWEAFAQEMGQRGVLKDGHALQTTATATSVRVRDGKTTTTDGPFAETKEQLGGFYLIECADLDEAIEIASKIPAALDGTVEVRPLMAFE